LVDDDLAGVGEVAELSLPGDQCVREIETVAILEAQIARLAEGTVDNLDRRLVLRKELQGADGMPVDDVVQDGVALAECATLRILSGQADAMPLGRQGREGQRLGRRPIERLPAVGHRPPPIEAPLQRFVHMEPFGDLSEPREQLGQSFDRNAGARIVVGWFVSPLVTLPNSRQRLRRGGEFAAALFLEGAFQLVEPLAGDAVGLFPGHAAEFQQVIEIAVAH